MVLGIVYHGVRKVYHGVRKVYHVIRKVYHGVRKVLTGRPGGDKQTNRRTNNQAIIEPSRFFESLVFNWFDLEFGNLCLVVNFRCCVTVLTF